MTKKTEKQREVLTKFKGFGCVEGSAITAYAADILNDPDLKKIHITRGKMHATGQRLQQAAHAIKNSTIRALYDPSAATGPKTATYLIEANVLYFNSRDSDAYSKSVIVHEAGHIINDIHRVQKVHVYDDEAFCYVIQAAYLTIKNFGFVNFEAMRSAQGGKVTAQAADVFRLAFKLANHYLKGGAHFLEDERDLRLTISHLPEYPNDDVKHYDGL